MNESTKLEALVKSAMEKVRELSEAETIIGKQIVTADGTTIIPVSKVSFGLASGGTDIGSDKKGFGGGSGAGRAQRRNQAAPDDDYHSLPKRGRKHRARSCG